MKILFCFLVFVFANENEMVEAQKSKPDIRKCCGITEILLEVGPGDRRCESVDKIGKIGLNPKNWRGLELKSYAIHHGNPTCRNQEHLVPVYYHVSEENSLDLMENGTLEFFTESRKDKVYFSYTQYCIDTLVMSHNFSLSNIDEGDVSEFAYICLDVSKSISDIVQFLIFPVGIGVSMGCLILTFLLYSLLPQLRDLTGRFILSICAFLTASYALRLVDIYGEKDPNVEMLAVEIVEHACVLGAWLSLSCMGHHVWKVIMSKSVFTRVTDGQRCCYYSIYVVTTACVVISIAVTLHFTVEEEPIPRSQIGYLTLGIFYLPVGLLLLINMYFYWNCTRQIGKQLVYNRSMQHFQVNFDLFSKLLMVLASCCLFQTLGFLDIVALYYIGMVFTILQGPLVFLVSMFRTRVAYLFKKYFCKENSCVCCCGGNGDFIELASTELSTIDKLREKVENDDVEVNKSLLDRWGDASGRPTKDRELSKSLFNVREKSKDGAETPLMKVGRLLKTNSMNLANLNFGWRRETSV